MGFPFGKFPMSLGLLCSTTHHEKQTLCFVVLFEKAIFLSLIQIIEVADYLEETYLAKFLFQAVQPLRLSKRLEKAICLWRWRARGMLKMSSK